MRLFVALVLLLVSGVSVADKLLVVTSIKPLALIITAVAGDLVEIDTLVEPGQSPHHLQLRPSKVERLYQADLLVWIGEDFEHYLQKPVNKVNSHLRLKPLIKGDNPHIWLNPIAPPLLADAISSRLAALQPSSAEIFKNNANSFKENWRLSQIDWKSRATALKSSHFVTNHDSFDDFFNFYKLNKPFSVFEHGGHLYSAKKQASLEKWIADKAVVCFIEEVGGSTVLSKKLAGKIPFVSVDVLASRYGLQVDSFIQYNDDVMKSLEACQTN